MKERSNEPESRLMKIYENITFQDAKSSSFKRENANINGDTAMGSMLQMGSAGAREYFLDYVLKPEHAAAHKNGDIHIHDLDFYTTTTTCTQIDLLKLFKDGFSTGHGVLREPNDIQSYAALACIAIQSNQNDQHGGQSIVNFDYGLAPGVAKTFRKRYRENMVKALGLKGAFSGKAYLNLRELSVLVEKTLAANGFYIRYLEGSDQTPNKEYLDKELDAYRCEITIGNDAFLTCRQWAYAEAVFETERATYQAMESLTHNLNTMHSRAGAQVPFSSINYGMDASPEGRLVTRSVLLAHEAGLGGGETPIFPIHVFRVCDGVSGQKDDPNYDLFQLACRVSAKRLFPNFVFQDAPFNREFYNGTPETECASMGCRTRVLANVYDPDKAIAWSRGNLSFTSINLPRLAINANGDKTKFFSDLNNALTLCVDQLLDRLEYQSKRKKKNFPFLMNGVWLDSENLKPEDEVRDVLKHGTLSVGFIGLAETLVALTGKHHGESEESQKFGLEIIGFMRKRLDEEAEKRKLNFSLLATPAEGLSGRFVELDKAKYGVISGVTDREYYTNSFHVPVWYGISIADKIKIEAPYHALCNAGHIILCNLIKGLFS